MKQQRNYRLSEDMIEHIDYVRNLLNNNRKNGDPEWSEASIVDYLIALTSFEITDDRLIQCIDDAIYIRRDGRRKR